MRSLAQKIGIALLVLAAVCLYMGVTELWDIRPAAAYTDRGVHTFVPDRAYPVQVKNTATGRQGRLHPTKTVYMVHYKAADGSGYEWRDEASYRKAAEKIVAAGKPVARRVLSLETEGQYITVAGDTTARSYVLDQRWFYGWMSGLSALYLILFFAVWAVLRRNKRKHQTDGFH